MFKKSNLFHLITVGLLWLQVIFMAIPLAYTETKGCPYGAIDYGISMFDCFSRGIAGVIANVMLLSVIVISTVVFILLALKKKENRWLGLMFASVPLIFVIVHLFVCLFGMYVYSTEVAYHYLDGPYGFYYHWSFNGGYLLVITPAILALAVTVFGSFKKIGPVSFASADQSMVLQSEAVISAQTGKKVNFCAICGTPLKGSYCEGCGYKNV